MSERAGSYQRSASGMIGAMVVLVVLVVALVAIRSLLQEEPTETVETVDYRKTAELAQEQVDFRLLSPEALPDGWRATSVRFTPEPTPGWHLGVLTGEGRYVGLEQARSSEENMVEKHVDPDAVMGDAVEIGGDTWRSWTDEGGDTALTRVEADVTTLVVGTPGQDVLVEFVETLP